MNINVEYVYHDEDNSEVLKQKSIWDKALHDQIQLYSMVLAEMLHDINIPHDAAINVLIIRKIFVITMMSLLNVC